MRNRIVLLWLTAIPLLVLGAYLVSCSRYSTHADWQWSPPRRVAYRQPAAYSPLAEALEEGTLPEPTFVQDPVPPPEPTEETHWKVHRVRARMTACSPKDPRDSGYYSRHGWEGAKYNMCFDLKVIPRGSFVRITPEDNEYMDVSFPGKFWEVDAAGGPVIRRSTGRGKVHGDVKYTTLYSVSKFGNKPDIIIEVILPPGYEPGWVFNRSVVEVVWLPKSG